MFSTLNLVASALLCAVAAAELNPIIERFKREEALSQRRRLTFQEMLASDKEAFLTSCPDGIIGSMPALVPEFIGRFWVSWELPGATMLATTTRDVMKKVEGLKEARFYTYRRNGGETRVTIFGKTANDNLEFHWSSVAGSVVLASFAQYLRALGIQHKEHT